MEEKYPLFPKEIENENEYHCTIDIDYGNEPIPCKLLDVNGNEKWFKVKRVTGNELGCTLEFENGNGNRNEFVDKIRNELIKANGNGIQFRNGIENENELGNELGFGNENQNENENELKNKPINPSGNEPENETNNLFDKIQTNWKHIKTKINFK